MNCKLYIHEDGVDLLFHIPIAKYNQKHWYF